MFSTQFMYIFEINSANQTKRFRIILSCVKYPTYQHSWLWDRHYIISLKFVRNQRPSNNSQDLFFKFFLGTIRTPQLRKCCLLLIYHAIVFYNFIFQQLLQQLLLSGTASAVVLVKSFYCSMMADHSTIDVKEMDSIWSSKQLSFQGGRKQAVDSSNITGVSMQRVLNRIRRWATFDNSCHIASEGWAQEARYRWRWR